MGKKGKSNKQAWLDWLADDPPAPAAKDELRERFKQQANSYRPRNRAAAPRTSTQVLPQTPVKPQQPPAQPVLHTTPASKATPGASTAPTPATVSIQIHIPAFHTERFKRAVARVKQWLAQLKVWVEQGWKWLLQQLQLQYQEHRSRTIGVVAAIVVLLIAPLGFTLFHGANSGAAGGSSKGAAAGGATKKQAKPTYEVVRPSNKPNLATPDGSHTAYDSTHQVYSYRDNIGTNGFTVSQQPVPAKFATGELAVKAIAPTVMKGITPVKLDVITGTAELATNPNNGSQIVVASVRTLLLFIQSGHQFTVKEWQDYLNTLQ